MTAVLWALVVLPLIVGALLAVGAALRPGLDRSAVPVAVGTAAAVLVLAVLAATGRPQVRAPFLAGTDVELAVDGLSAVMVVMVAAVTLLVLLFSGAYLRAREARTRFFGLMLLFTGAMLVTVTATNLLVLLFAWELMGAMSYALIGFWWREPDRVRSANTAFLVTRTADVGQYVAAGAALAGAGSLAFTALPGASSGWRDVVAAGLIVSALGKSAQLPFSFWISRAMAGPSPVSALLHSATMVAAGGYLLLRLRPLLDAVSWAGPSVAWAGALTAVALGAVAVVQSDLKQLLAASTSAQIGFVVLAAGVGATAGGASQLVAHAAVKSALFLAAGAWLTSRGTKALRSLRGAAREDRVLGAATAVALLTLAGIPPLSLWLTKDSVLAVAREDSFALYLVGLVGSVLSAAYAGRALGVLVTVRGRDERPDPRDVEEEPTGSVPGLATFAVVVLAAAGAVLGVQALPVVEQRYADSFGGVAVVPGPVELALSAVLALLVVVALLHSRGRLPAAPSALRGWLGLEAASTRAVLRPTLVLARVLARADDRLLDRGVLAAAGLLRGAAGGLACSDDRVLDRGVQAGAALTVRAAERASAGDERGVDGGVSALAAATRRLGMLARRPQTGQLHQYYVQAAVVLAALLLVALIGR
jgi:NADH:ubiquinone oxidoreductase subunit 5 (subunit L)/multisubunit Na+/H+ antiporter MnhA subunit